MQWPCRSIGLGSAREEAGLGSGAVENKPVVVLNAPGYTMAMQPLRAAIIASSGNRTS